MSAAIDIKEVSELLHIEPLHADIYITLLIHGELSKKELKDLLSLVDDDIEQAINKLLHRGLIWRLSSAEGQSIYQALSILQLEERLERDKEVLRHLKKFVIPRLQQPHKLGLLRYEGIEGIRKVYFEVLEEARRTKEPILAIETELDAPMIGRVFLDNYIKQRLENKITAYVMSPDTPQDREYKSNYEGRFTYVKLLPNFDISANINIVGDLVMTYSIDAAEGTLRRSHAEAETFKAIFNKLWGVLSK